MSRVDLQVKCAGKMQSGVIMIIIFANIWVLTFRCLTRSIDGIFVEEWNANVRENFMCFMQISECVWCDLSRNFIRGSNKGFILIFNKKQQRKG